MKVHFSFLLLALLPGLVAAAPGNRPCVPDSRSSIFEEYHSLSDQEISRRCTYDIEKLEPAAGESKINANTKRTSNCESGLNKMREISGRYLAKQKEICLAAQSAPTCDETTTQFICVADAGRIANKVKKGQEELSAIMLEGKKKLASISRFNRLLTARFRRQQSDLWRMPLPEKKKPFSAQDRVNNPPKSTRDGSRPEVSRPNPPAAKSAPRSTVSTANQRPANPRGSELNSFTSPGSRPELRPQDYGARSWAEFEKKLPLLIQQNEQATQQLQRFEEARQERHSEHQATAAEMALKAGQFFATAEKLGYAGEDLAQWKKEKSTLPSGQTPTAPVARAEDASIEEEEPPPQVEAPELAPNLAQEEEAAPTKAEVAEAKSATPESDEPALASFEAKLRDQPQTTTMVAERKRLRDLLKKRMQALKDGESAQGMEAVPGSLVGDILAETKVAAGRDLASSLSEPAATGTVDVEGALRDIEAQLRELDKQGGILESASPSLFERVKILMKKYAKSMQ